MPTIPKLLLAVLLAATTCSSHAFYRIVVIGDSIGTGYGLASESDSFVQQLARSIRSERPDVRLINLSKNGYSLAVAERELDSLLDFSGRPEVCVVALGGNDFLSAVPAAQSAARLKTICATIKRRYPRAALIVVGFGYASEKDVVYDAVAHEIGASCLSRFDWEAPEAAHLRQADGIHPLEPAHQEIAARIVPLLPKPKAAATAAR